MIEARCTACGSTLEFFETTAEYLRWRRKNDKCECGALLNMSIFTREINQAPVKKKEPAKRGISKLWR